MTRDELIRCLTRLSEALEAQGLQGEILLTGGASMCLVHSARDMTKDIDALYEPKEVINRITAQIAEEEGVPEGWLNDSVKGFVEKGAPREDFMTLGGLRIATVSAEYLLAMKLVSARYGETDYDDARFLMRKLGITSEEGLCEVVSAYYPVERIYPRTRYLILQLVDEYEQEQEHEPRQGPDLSM